PRQRSSPTPYPAPSRSETDLAAEFAVPRTRIRDALAALEQRGLVERIPNRGAVVIRLDLSQALHIYDVRCVLEGLAARLATQNTDRKSTRLNSSHVSIA